jgi:type III restriction enzyme
MELKEYQKRVVKEAEGYFRALEREQDGGNRKHGAKDAWEAVGISGVYTERRNGLNEDLPTVCVKVPTGGGKTLLATQILGVIQRTILKQRNGAGLVLWVVPSSQIYRDTLKRLRDRNDMYRLMLEHAISRRIEVWEKGEIARLSPGRLRECLNILVVQLASTNRETKEQLKFFKDSGGAIVQRFPAEDDLEGQRKLKAEIPNMEVVEGTELVKTSVGNLVRICRPAVILDEGHKATSDLARRTIEGFNASVVVELSATPVKEANVLCRVGGMELLREEMIKLPINISTSGAQNWKDVLTKARDKRTALAAKAAEWASKKGEGRLIRPIVLVQVERTGADQEESGFIHAKQVETYLTEKLSVSPGAVKIKSATNDGLEDIDLMDEGCPVEWIITKSALQEGWDCPFAYILVSLVATGSGTAMTQLVGRVLRQPFTRKTGVEELDESYVYCLKQRAGEAAKQVKNALEKEGYEGDEASAMVREGTETTGGGVQIRIRREFSKLYGKPFEGKVYLPRFCLKEGEGKRATYRPLDYYRDLLAAVEVEKFGYSEIGWDLSEELRNARDRFQKLTLGERGGESRRVSETEADLVEGDDQVCAWIAASLPFDCFSFKQLQVVVRNVYSRLVEGHLPGAVRGRLALVKFVVRNRIESFVREQMDKQTEKVFGRLFESGRILFYLHCKECNFEVPVEIERKIRGKVRQLSHDDGKSIAKSLFDMTLEEDYNDLEREIALVLDRDVNVLWWLRNLVGRDNFRIQGFRREMIHPDFVVQEEIEGKKHNRVLVIESKGDHLKGNDDTLYKRKVAGYFERAGKEIAWQQLGGEFKDGVFRFQVLDEKAMAGGTWKDQLLTLLAEGD